MAFEHGAQFYDNELKKVRNLVLSSKKRWFNKAMKIMENYTRRTPNSFVETKNYALAWHFRNSPNDYGEFQAKNLVADLRNFFQGYAVSVILGKKVVEIKASEANKGRFVEWFLERYESGSEVIFAAGDDRTDEDMFNALNLRGVTLKIGKEPKSKVHYYLDDQKDFGPTIDYLFN